MADANIHVEVAYALPEKQRLIGLDVPEGTTMLEAARLSGIAEQFEGLDLDKAAMGLFGKVVANPGKQVLQAGERVEIYRPLKADPKLNRKKRAQEKAAKS
ncbi:RnfH family protein [Alcanivorax sp. S6407]|uniref:RnfH family protein n=1 Tax=Alcanivorax sp. S6407 TaxID=2926424 RepID=UPI001FF6765E|nr:RnfH family protein [Alcanivorax sp. S6407]MCK0154027.1 RnfH family protein [Alcanivorax sp. S6407]